MGDMLSFGAGINTVSSYVFEPVGGRSCGLRTWVFFLICRWMCTQLPVEGHRTSADTRTPIGAPECPCILLSQTSFVSSVEILSCTIRQSIRQSDVVER